MRFIWALGCVIAAFGNIETMMEPGRETWKVVFDGLAMMGWLTAAVAAIFAKRWLAE